MSIYKKIYKIWHLAGQLGKWHNPQQKRLVSWFHRKPVTSHPLLSQNPSRTLSSPPGPPSSFWRPLVAPLVSPFSSAKGSALFAQNSTRKWRPRSNTWQNFSFFQKRSSCRDSWTQCEQRGAAPRQVFEPWRFPRAGATRAARGPIRRQRKATRLIDPQHLDIGSTCGCHRVKMPQ